MMKNPENRKRQVLEIIDESLQWCVLKKPMLQPVYPTICSKSPTGAPLPPAWVALFLQIVRIGRKIEYQKAEKVMNQYLSELGYE